MAHQEDFTPDQVRTLMLMERIGGSISLFAVMFIFVAYAVVPRARNVQNTFIVFASVSNVGASIASIIAFDGLEAGKGTALCQAQSFLFEMFMQSDPWWALAMAINVLLVFYFHATPDSFQTWWWVYCSACYGGPFIIALALLLVRTKERGPIYGEATIWCWVDRRWDSIRIYTYYMLIWVCIVGSIICYILVGYHVFRSRNKLRSLTASKTRDGMPDLIRPDLNEGGYATVVTEVQITRTTLPAAPPKSQGSSNASSEAYPQRPFGPTDSIHIQPVSGSYYHSSVTSPCRTTGRTSPSPLSRVASATRSVASKFVIDDPIKRAYLRTSFLFAISVLVTWIPSSMNRIHSWLAGSSPFEYHVATAAVLPLQGLWNAIIFFVTSWSTVRKPSRSDSIPGVIDGTDRANGESALSRPRLGLHDCCDSETDLGDEDSRTMGSEIELRGLSSPKGDGMAVIHQNCES